MNTGEAWIEGPATKDEAAELDALRAKRDDWVEELAELRKDMEAEDSEGIREIIRGDIKHAERILSIIGQLTDRFGR